MVESTDDQNVTATATFLAHASDVDETDTTLTVTSVQATSANGATVTLSGNTVTYDPSHAAACYILAVMLERKRILKVKEQIKHDGHRVFVYEQPSTGDVFTVADPDLQLNQLEAVQRDVAQLLEHGLNPPPTPAPVPDPAPAEAVPAGS